MKAITETRLICRELSLGCWFAPELIRRAMDACGMWIPSDLPYDPGLTPQYLGWRWVDEGFCDRRLEKYPDGSWCIQFRFHP